METAIKITAIVYIIIAIVIIGSCSVTKDTAKPIVKEEVKQRALYLVSNQIYVKTGDVLTLNIPSIKENRAVDFYLDGQKLQDVKFWGEHNVKVTLPDLKNRKVHLYAVFDFHDTSNTVNLVNVSLQ